MRKTILFLTLLSGFSVFSAGSDDTVIAFSTVGPDRYADGTTVMDGECYALVWSGDGVFEGFTASGEPQDSADKVVIIAPVADGGRCPDINFQIDSEEVEKNESGVYAVYLLDTRVKAGDTVRPSGSSAGIDALNGYGAVTKRTVSIKAVSSGDFPVLGGEERPQVADQSAAAPKNLAQPKIKSFRLEGDYAYLKVENLSGYLRVQHGADVTASDGTGVAVAADGAGDDVILIAPKSGGSGFYKVVRN